MMGAIISLVFVVVVGVALLCYFHYDDKKKYGSVA